jgi:single-strand DNA-binding protein
MAIHTQQSLSGFIVTDPDLTITSKGESRFYAKIGQEHFQRNDDGSFTQLESTFHNLVQYRKAAERSYERFQKGDNFVAEGYVHEYDHDVDGQTQHGEEFVAKKIGHDAARQSYTVNRKTPAAGPVDQDHTFEAGGVAAELPTAGVEAPGPGSAAASSSGTGRRDQLAAVPPDSAHRTASARSNPLAL